jgi:hypothetical protein
VSIDLSVVVWRKNVQQSFASQEFRESSRQATRWVYAERIRVHLDSDSEHVTSRMSDALANSLDKPGSVASRYTPVSFPIRHLYHLPQ